MLHPLVLLDSGRGLDESVYLQLLYSGIRLEWKKALGGTRRQYLFYPPKTPPEWYDLDFSWDQWDYHHRRPIRGIHRNLDYHGMLHTAANFEKGCIFKHYPEKLGRAPWRFRTTAKSNAAFVYLNPTKRDLDFAKWNHKQYWEKEGIPYFCVGDAPSGTMPMGYSAFVDRVFTYSKERKERFRSVTGKKIGSHIRSQGLLGAMAGQSEVVIAGNHGNRFRQRYPEMLQKWLEAVGVPSRVHDCRSGQQFLDGLRGRYYCVLTRQEANPFDILLAQARGMVPVLPRTPLFQRLGLERVIYYPASLEGHFGVRLNTLDARTWFQNAFQNGTLKPPI